MLFQTHDDAVKLMNDLGVRDRYVPRPHLKIGVRRSRKRPAKKRRNHHEDKQANKLDGRHRLRELWHLPSKRCANQS